MLRRALCAQAIAPPALAGLLCASAHAEGRPAAPDTRPPLHLGSRRFVPSLQGQIGGGSAFGGYGGQLGVSWATALALDVGPFAALGYRPRSDLAPPLYVPVVGMQARAGHRHRALLQLGYGGLRTRKRRLHGEAIARAVYQGGFVQLGYEHLWPSGVQMHVAMGPNYVPGAGGFQWLGGASAGVGFRWAP